MPQKHSLGEPSSKTTFHIPHEITAVDRHRGDDQSQIVRARIGSRWVEAVENGKEMRIQIQHRQPPTASRSNSKSLIYRYLLSGGDGYGLSAPTAILRQDGPTVPAEFPDASVRPIVLVRGAPHAREIIGAAAILVAMPPILLSFTEFHSA
jgi:hypothetical protein